MTNILYIPLDERACNYRFPVLLSEMTEDTKVLVPPRKYMGMLKQPANVDKLWEWVFSNVPNCDYAILSVDTLIYGNIINSRIHNKDIEECSKYLEKFKQIKMLNNSIEVHAFNLVARVANYNSDSEDPYYWATHGAQIWKYSYLKDKIKRGHADDQEKSEFADLQISIPKEYLNDFLKRRDVDRFVNISCLDLLKQRYIDYLVVPKDDTAEYGYAALDQEAVAQKVYNNRLMNRVMVYPGADEVGSILFARVFNRIKNYKPKVYIRYSSTLGPTIVPKYEDRPLNEGIKAQITSLGGVVVDSALESDFMLAVHAPGKYMIESMDQYEKDLSFYSHVNMHEFLNYIEYYINNLNKPCVLADIAFSNGADNELMIYAKQKGVLEKIAGYGGWNTSQNTIGVVLAHGVLCSYYNNFIHNLDKQLLSSEFLLRKIIEDWLFQSNVLHEMLWKHEEFPQIDPYKVGEWEETVIKTMGNMIKGQIDKEFNNKFMGKNIEFNNLNLPWKRIFDIDFDVKLM